MDGRLLRNRGGRPASLGRFLVPTLLVLSLSLNIYLLFYRDVPRQEPDIAPENQSTSAPVPTSKTQEEAPAEVDATAAAENPVSDKGAHRLKVSVEGSIAQTFSRALGPEEGDLVSAFVSRIFMWYLDLKNDVRPGDEITFIYTFNAADRQVDITAATYRSLKNSTTYRAYKFRRSGHNWWEFFDDKGQTVALQLENSPLDSYEQITSLLRDRPTHEGMDFKTPIGTPVKAPFAGKVLRVNWAFRFNGDSIEIQYADGTLAKFLHLDRIKPGIAPGRSVAQGEVIAESGNTGRSTAPHLHYQLNNRAGKVLDPLDYHHTNRLLLEGEDAQLFLAERDRLDAQLVGRLPPTSLP